MKVGMPGGRAAPHPAASTSTRLAPSRPSAVRLSSPTQPTSILINVSRGGLIDTNALIAALEANALAGVAMDVCVVCGAGCGAAAAAGRCRCHRLGRTGSALLVRPNPARPHASACRYEDEGRLFDTDWTEVASGQRMKS